MNEVKKKRTINILIVDDEEEICKILYKMLLAEGHKVKIAFISKKALGLLEKEYFDLVFLDVFMPGISGVEILDKIAVISPDTRVVMMTGKIIDNNFIRKMKIKGALRCIQKPFKLEEIENILFQFI